MVDPGRGSNPARSRARRWRHCRRAEIFALPTMGLAGGFRLWWILGVAQIGCLGSRDHPSHRPARVSSRHRGLSHFRGPYFWLHRFHGGFDPIPS
jgi:hypothetical protein